MIYINNIDFELSYTGCKIDNKRSGYGTIIYKDGTKLLGKFKNDKLFGECKLIGDDFNYTFNTESNYGKLIFNNIWTYTGEFTNHIINGFGTQIYNYPNNGYITNDDDDDESKIIYSYVGEFKRWKKHGKGKIIKNNKIILEGIWENDILNNNSVIYYLSHVLNTNENDVDIYSYKSIHVNDHIYEGFFINNENENENFGLYGYGIHIDNHNNIYKGYFKNNKYIHYGQLNNNNKELHIGKWKNNKKYGKMKCKYITDKYSEIYNSSNFHKYISNSIISYVFNYYNEITVDNYGNNIKFLNVSNDGIVLDTNDGKILKITSVLDVHENETNILTSINHLTFVPKIYESYIDNDIGFIIMEKIKKPSKIDEKNKFIELFNNVKELHKNNVIHTDLHNNNIIGSNIIDFADSWKYDTDEFPSFNCLPYDNESGLSQIEYFKIFDLSRIYFNFIKYCNDNKISKDDFNEINNKMNIDNFTQMFMLEYFNKNRTLWNLNDDNIDSYKNLYLKYI